MSHRGHTLTIIVAAAFGLLPASAARAQWYSSYSNRAPAYAYRQPYAVEVAPNTYVIRRPDAQHHNPHARTVRPQHAPPRHQAERAPSKGDRPHKPNDPALIEELRKRSKVKTDVVHTTRIVRDPPLVIEHKRVVDDPPRVIERRHVVEDVPRGRGLFTPPQTAEVQPPVTVITPPPRHGHAPVERPARVRQTERSATVTRSRRVHGKPAEKPGQPRIIEADAEVTVIGPDRMTIRLFRKGQGPKAKTQ